MAEEIRRLIRWENKERLRKRREEKNREREEAHKRNQRCKQSSLSILQIQNDAREEQLHQQHASPDKRIQQSFQAYAVIPTPRPTSKRSPNSSVASSQSFTSFNSTNDQSGPLFSPPLKNTMSMIKAPLATPLFSPPSKSWMSTKNAPPTRASLTKYEDSDCDQDDDDDDDGLMRDALLLAQRKSQQSLPAPSTNGENRSSRNKPLQPGSVPAMPESSGESDSDPDDLLRDALRLKATLKKDTNQLLEERPYHSEPQGTPEEIAICDTERESMESPPAFMTLEQENVETTISEEMSGTPRRYPVTTDSLWSDSENELVATPEANIAKSRKRRRPTSSISNDSLPNRIARASDGYPVTRTTNVPQVLSPNGGYHVESDDNVDIEKLMPHFDNPKLGPPADLEPLILRHSSGESIVPAAINRYLKGYQREGVVFMHNRISNRKGVILGDDMGLGKTVQVISLLAALLEKEGCGKDNFHLKKRRTVICHQLDQDRREQERALRCGDVIERNKSVDCFVTPPKWMPILVVVPPSIIENWMNEFNAWGHFGVIAFTGPSRDLALNRIRDGLDEIMVCGRTMLQNDDDLLSVKQIKWKLLVVDEYHQYKNFRTKLYSGLKSLRDSCDAPLVGLTGTLMQNNHEELWSEVDLVNPGFLGTWEEFKDDTSVPIKLGRTKTADDAAVEEGNQVRDWLKTKLKSFYLQRRKIDVLKDDLPEKNERVVFCELSPLQKRLYQHMMTLPDVVLVKYANAPCECGINQAIFQGFKHMRTDREKIAYQRNHRDDIIPRKSCCHKRPLNIFRFDAGEEFYDCRAPLWRWQHQRLVSGEVEVGAECKSCPYCISFAVLDKLYKLSSHVSLLQLPKHPNEHAEGSRAWKDAQKALDFAKVAFPEDVLDSLPGGSYIREDGIMDDHSNLSGKMKMLADLLIEFNRRDDRLLIFSFSTQTLDLIQNFVRAQGYSFLRLDGSTPSKARQGLVDKYQRDKNIFLFLISTKAGGLGLNLTAANVVIVFDVDFNPSNDEQSQDRAYRIGQKRDVLVIRLVSRGTIEELKYIRQLYKLQLKNFTIGSAQGEQTTEDAEAARMFRAVEGDKDRKGELFGMENLLKFKDGSFMDDLWKSTAKKSTRVKGLERFGLCNAMDMADEIEGMSEKGINDIGGNIVDDAFNQAALKAFNGERAKNDSLQSVEGLLRGDNSRSHADFLRADRGDALFKPGDHGFEEEMGGYSQAEHYVMENAEIVDEVERVPSPVPSNNFLAISSTISLAAPSPVRSAPLASRSRIDLGPFHEASSLSSHPAAVAELSENGGLSFEHPPSRKLSETKPQRSTFVGATSSATTICLGKKGSSLFSSKDLYIPGKKRKKKKDGGAQS